MPQDVRPLRPKRGHRPPDGRVFAGGVRVDKPRVGNFTAGGTVDAMNFRVREGSVPAEGKGPSAVKGKGLWRQEGERAGIPVFPACRLECRFARV